MERADKVLAAGRIVKTFSPLPSRVFDAFDAAHIPWLLASNEPAIDRETEVEVLLHARSAGPADVVLRSLGYVRVATSHGGARARYLGYQRADEEWTWLHLATELTFGRDLSFRADVVEPCLARRQIVDGIATLAPQDAFWVLLLRGLLDDRGFDPARSARLVELSRDAGIPSEWPSLVEPICPPPWSAARLADSVSRQDWESLRDLGPRIEGRWRRRDRSRVPIRKLAEPFERLFTQRSLVLGRPGLTVALLGPDGSGKSILASSIARSFPFPARTVYLGLWQGPIRRAKPLVPGTDLLGRLAFAWRRYLVGRYHRARRRLVLFDRYPYDALLALHDGQPTHVRLYFWLLGRSCPAPDLVFLLDTPGDVAYARKGEHDSAQLETLRQGYLALRARLPAIEVIDANRPLETVRSELIDRIWESYRARWGTRGRFR